MAVPEPVPGLVIRYSYLWYNEAAAGAEEGRKDRPAVIVLALRRSGDETVVLVAPVTHSAPANADAAIEIPAATKQRLGLDDARSWIVADDLNQFVWPGPDVRATPDGSFAYGELPAPLFSEVRKRVLALARTGGGRVSKRTD